MASFFTNLFRPKNIKYFVGIAVLVVLGGLYLWYADNYGNKKQIILEGHKVIDYEWQSVAASYNVTTDYIWARTKSVLINDDGFVPSYYMIQGELTEEEDEYSSSILLTDQALLLSVYVRNNDRIAAMNLKDNIVREFRDSESGLFLSDIGNGSKTVSVHDNMIFLDSLLDYYSFSGSKGDYQLISEMCGLLFDEEGNIMPSELSYATLLSNDVQFEDGQVVSDSSKPENTSTIVNKFNGIELRAIKLKLINNLEINGLIAEGSYDKALAIVRGGLISGEIGLYAYGYAINTDGSTDYIYEGSVSGSVDVEASIETLLNLVEVNEGNNVSYSLIKRLILNSNKVGNMYQLITGEYYGSVNLNSYLYCLKMAEIMDDEPFFEVLCKIIGGQVATYSSSPVLSMVFRTRGYRYLTYAEDNLLTYLLLT